jgi:hypothetical protein
VVLTTHPLLVPRSRKSRAIPLPPLWAFGSVTGYLYLYFGSYDIWQGAETLAIRNIDWKYLESLALEKEGEDQLE